MKKVLSFLLAIVIISSSLFVTTNNVHASEPVVDGFYVDKALTVSLTEFRGMAVRAKKEVLLIDNSYLVLQGYAYSVRDVLYASDSQLQENRITIDEYFNDTEDVVLSEAGTYGNITYAGDVTVTAADVTIENAVIKGNLTIAESVGEGEVYLDNITVEGETKILGGGTNSVYFTDSVIATVIVNKNDGTVRVVVEGNSRVDEVQLESGAILQENGATGEGFTNVTMVEALRNSTNEVELIGTFDTINVRAVGVNIALDGATSIEDLVLSAIATVVGEGAINRLQVSSSASGSAISHIRPQSTLFIGNGYVNIEGEEVTESYSNEENSEIQSITATPAYIDVNLSAQLFNLTGEDFEVTASVNGTPVELTDVSYEPTLQKLFFTPISNSYGETVSITVKPSTDNSSLLGEATTTYTNRLGFSGQIRDIYNVPASNIAVTVAGYDRTVTDEDGYYFLATDNQGVFNGTISGPGYLTGNMIATVANGVISTGVDETIMRAAASDEIKIMLTWNDQEPDIDSHLATENFHVYFANREHYGSEGYQYVDLDWDDTNYHGPETTTIRQFEDGEYIFFIHNWTNYSELSESESKVEVFAGNSNIPDFTFNVPADTEANPYWAVFKINVSRNGTNVLFEEVDVLYDNMSDLFYEQLGIEAPDYWSWDEWANY